MDLFQYQNTFNTDIRQKILSLSSFWYECRCGRPWCLIHYTHLADYWWWTIIGWLMMMSASEGGPTVTMLDRHHHCERDGAAIWGQPTLIWTDGQHCPIIWIIRGVKEQKRIIQRQRCLYILWEFRSFSENWLWSRKRPWPAIITPWNQKLFLREIWEQLFFLFGELF